MIYVTLGTMFLDFSRLVDAADRIAAETGERVVVQRGMHRAVPLHCEHFSFKPHEELLAIQAEARVIIAHAGIGAVRDALRVRRPFIVVPRRKRYREHMNDHQLELARAVERRGWGRAIYDITKLPAAVAAPPCVPAQYLPAKRPLLNALSGEVSAMIDGWLSESRQLIDPED